MFSSLRVNFLLQRTSLRFDGSDLQPGEVGTGEFWNQHH